MAGLSLRVLLQVLWVLSGTLQIFHCERHSLTYIYTALSKKVDNPGIHEFTAMGLLDTKMIDYFDSDLQQKVPKQGWMKERLPQDYWAKGTESRKSKQQWFKVNLEILKERMRQNDSDVHVLQWMHGCEADLLPDGKLQFERGIDMYSYDGNNFLYFDDAHEVWVAGGEEAKPTKRKWDEVQVLKDYTKGYLKNECVEWLGKFINYGQQQLKHAAPPDVYMFASVSRHASSVLLTCMATGFYPPDIVLTIKRGSRVLTEDDGVMTTGIRPNQDDTYQRRDSILILRSDEGVYSCEVVHAATNVRINKVWDSVFPEHPVDEASFPVGPVVGGVIVGILAVAALIIGGVVYKRRRDRQEYVGVPTVSGSMNDTPPPNHVVVPMIPASNNDNPAKGPGPNNKGSSDSLDKKPTEGSDSDSGKGSSESNNGGSDSGSSEDIQRKNSEEVPLLSDGMKKDHLPDHVVVPVIKSNDDNPAKGPGPNNKGSSDSLDKKPTEGSDSDSGKGSSESNNGGSDSGSSEDIQRKNSDGIPTVSGSMNDTPPPNHVVVPVIPVLKSNDDNPAKGPGPNNKGSSDSLNKKPTEGSDSDSGKGSSESNNGGSDSGSSENTQRKNSDDPGAAQPLLG